MDHIWENYGKNGLIHGIMTDFPSRLNAWIESKEG
jgi:hypothetical protein